MRVITKDALIRCIFAQIQADKLKDGKYPHYGSYKQWMITGKEIERAIAVIFADNSIFKPTKEVEAKDEQIHK